MKSEELDSTDLILLDALQRDTTESNQALAERLGLSAPTCLRRLRRLREGGWIEREVAVLRDDRIGPLLTAVAEVSLDRQDTDSLQAFAERVAADDAVQQCHRVSAGPDFVLILTVRDMPAYQALAERLFTRDANVRNLRVYFSVERIKFSTALPLSLPLPEPRTADR